jgi:Fe-S cluster assembly iron-binding protein IscA
MALDEPKEEDEIIERGVYRILLDQQIQSLIEQAGPVEIDFVDTPTQKGYMVRVGKPGGDSCCGSDGGECGSGCG